MDGMIDPRPVPPAPKPPQGIPWQQAVISDKPGWFWRLLGAKFREDRGYSMRPGEMPIDTLRRMQRDRKF